MANITSKKSGLPVSLWSDHNGKNRNVSYNVPRMKITIGSAEVSVSVSENPEILAKTPNISHSDMRKIQKGMEYIGRNYDIFLKHYYDTTDDFDDEDMFNALRERGEYK